MISLPSVSWLNCGVKKKTLTGWRGYSKLHRVGHELCVSQRSVMEKIVEQGLLYDFYGELLTEHQKHIYEDVVFENLSLGEIAQEEGVSRQAVHDIIRRCDRALAAYEAKLGLVHKFLSIKEKIEEIDLLSKQYEKNPAENATVFGAEVRRISGEILEQL